MTQTDPETPQNGDDAGMEFALTVEVTEFVQPDIVEQNLTPTPVDLVALDTFDFDAWQKSQGAGAIAYEEEEAAAVALKPWDAEAYWAYSAEWMARVQAGEITPGTAADPWRIWDTTGEVA